MIVLYGCSRGIDTTRGGRAQTPILPTSPPPPAILGEFNSRIEVHERDKKGARYATQHMGIYFNHIGKFENELTQLAEEAKKEKSRAYQREYERIKAREYRARKKAQAAAPAQ